MYLCLIIWKTQWKLKTLQFNRNEKEMENVTTEMNVASKLNIGY